MNPIPLHDAKNALARSSVEGPREGDARTCTNGQPISEARATWRAEVKRIAREACTTTLSILGVGRALGLSDSAGRKLCDPTDPLPLSLGDVVAVGASGHEGGREWAEQVLSESLAVIRGRGEATQTSLDRLQRLIARDAGVFADILDKALADQRVTKEEARDLLHIARQLRRSVDKAIEKLEDILVQ